MSKSKNQILSIWEDVLLQGGRKRSSLTHTLGELSPRDASIVSDAYCLWVMCAIDFLGDTFVDSWKRWFDTICEIPVDVLADAMDTADRLLFRLKETEYADEYPYTYMHFKHALQEQVPSAGALFAPLKGKIEAVINNDFGDAKKLRSFLLFPSRLTLHDMDVLNEKAISDLLEIEEKNRSFVFCDPTPLADILKEWWTEPGRYIPGHGPGIVAEAFKRKPTQNDKYTCLPTALSHYVAAREGVMDVPGSLKPTLRTSRCICVPKSMTKKRVISAEPAALMYVQQGIGRMLWKGFSKFHKHCDLRDSNKSREDARRASISRKFATIDLSRASDSISWSFASAVFKDIPILPYLRLTRSQSVLLPDGTVIREHRSSPSGSALCFPVECLIFGAIVENAIRKVGTKNKYFRIYGDDIVVATDVVPQLLNDLTSFGFFPNEAKSFYGLEPFRESCGGDFYDGVDVYPIRLSRRFTGFSSPTWTPSQFLSLIDQCNRCFTLFPLVRRCLISEMKKRGYNPLFSDDLSNASALFSPTPTNFCAFAREAWAGKAGHRKSFDYQIDSLKVSSVVQPKAPNVEQGELALYHWLSSAEKSPDNIGALALASTEPKLKIQKKWVLDRVSPSGPLSKG